jgi:hypothetical protein
LHNEAKVYQKISDFKDDFTAEKKRLEASAEKKVRDATDEMNRDCKGGLTRKGVTATVVTATGATTAGVTVTRITPTILHHPGWLDIGGWATCPRLSCLLGGDRRNSDSWADSLRWG